MYLVVLGIGEFVMIIILNSSSRNPPVLLWAVFISVSFWFILSILVVIGTNGKHQRLLLVSAVLGMLGILGFAAYLFIYYGLRLHWGAVPWEITFGCVHLIVSFWYVLCIFGAMQEVKNEGIVYGTSGVEMGQPLPMQQQTGYITVPTISTERQQVYPTPVSLGVEMGQPKCDVEPSAPPSYCELFPPMTQLSN